MLWNWYTVDACFISSTWRITSSGMFAGSCIGVILLVMVLEGLRRASQEYDGYIVRSHVPPATNAAIRSYSDSDSDANNTKSSGQAAVSAVTPARRFRPTVVQQAMRSLLHMLQFAVAYFVMLLAMYYNGYFIICILIGAFLGAFVFSWTTMGVQ